MKETQLDLFDLNSFQANEIRTKPIKKVKSDKVRPPIRYPGSKYNASKFILPHMDIFHNEYREPFLGSGAIFFAKQKVDFNWLNDIDIELINTFKVIADPEKRYQLINKLQDYLPSKENFEVLKNSLLVEEIDRAFKYFAINRTAYSGIMNLPNYGFHPQKSVQPHQWPKRIEESGNKLNGTRITNTDYEEVILSESKNEVLLFIDPPYFLADQKRAYLHSFTEKEHIRLFEILKKCKHKFCLTYDNCDQVKNLYSWANIYQYNWRYHTANSNATDRKMGKELIITNY